MEASGTKLKTVMAAVEETSEPAGACAVLPLTAPVGTVAAEGVGLALAAVLALVAPPMASVVAPVDSVAGVAAVRASRVASAAAPEVLTEEVVERAWAVASLSATAC